MNRFRWLWALCTLSLLFACSAQAQRVIVDRQHFVVETSAGERGAPRLLLFLSYFDALRATELESDLDYIANDMKFDGIRIFPNWLQRDVNYCAIPDTDLLFDNAGNVRGDGGREPSGALQRLLAVIKAAASRGLVVDVSFVKNAGLSGDAYVRAVTRTAALMRPFGNVIIDVQNEVDVNQLAEAEVIRLRDAIRKDDPERVVMVSRSGPVADAAAYSTRLAMSAVAYHRLGGSRESGRRSVEADRSADLPPGAAGVEQRTAHLRANGRREPRVRRRPGALPYRSDECQVFGCRGMDVPHTPELPARQRRKSAEPHRGEHRGTAAARRIEQRTIPRVDRPPPPRVIPS